MPRSSRRGSGRIIPAGWGDAEDENLPGPSAPSPGTQATQPASERAPAPETSPAPERALPRRRRWWLLGGIAALLALVLVLPPLLLGQRSPEAEARSFLQAVLDADTDTVREHMAPPTDGALDVALTDQVLAAASARADRFTLEETTIDGDQAEVTARLGLGSSSEEVTLHLTRQRTGGLHRPVWELDPVVLPVVRLIVPLAAPALRVNGIEVELPTGTLGGPFLGSVEVHLALLPGTYDVSAVESGRGVAAVTTRASVPPVLGPWTGGMLDLSYTLTDEGVEEIRAHVIDPALAECARSTSPHPEGCPFSAPDSVTAAGTWEILTPPSSRIIRSQVGAHEFQAVDGIAAFTVPAEDDGEDVHRVPIDGKGVTMMNGSGQFVGGWYRSDGGVEIP